MSVSNPFISIIIPVYNVEQYIARCLESCVNQTFSDIEILIVDDCGSDDSIKIAKTYAEKDSRIHIIHNPGNLGLFGARLSREKEAKREYILPLDSDNYIELNTCKVLYRAITHTKKALNNVNFIPNPNLENALRGGH